MWTASDDTQSQISLSRNVTHYECQQKHLKIKTFNNPSSAHLRQYCSKILLVQLRYTELINSNPFRILPDIAHSISYGKHIHPGAFNFLNIFFDNFG